MCKQWHRTVQGLKPWIMLPQNKAFQLSLSYTNLLDQDYFIFKNKIRITIVKDLMVKPFQTHPKCSEKADVVSAIFIEKEQLWNQF